MVECRHCRVLLVTYLQKPLALGEKIIHNMILTDCVLWSILIK